MTTFKLIATAYFVFWMLFVMLCVAASSGAIFRSKRRDGNCKAYAFYGALIGAASIVFIFNLNQHFYDKFMQIGALELEAERTAQLYYFTSLKEYINLTVSIFGAGISGNLIVAAIIERRKIDA